MSKRDTLMKQASAVLNQMPAHPDRVSLQHEVIGNLHRIVIECEAPEGDLAPDQLPHMNPNLARQVRELEQGIEPLHPKPAMTESQRRRKRRAAQRAARRKPCPGCGDLLYPKGHGGHFTACPYMVIDVSADDRDGGPARGNLWRPMTETEREARGLPDPHAA